MDTRSDTTAARGGWRRWAGLAGWIAVTLLAPALAVGSGPGDWYARLEKPSWNPHSWVFGPVWTFLYLSMAVAAWRVWCRSGWSAPGRPLAWYGVQLALNAAWSPVFFRWHRPDLALGVILLLGLAIGATLLAFRRVSRLSALLLAPYLAWVGFATVLNATLWHLNPIGG